MATIKKIQLPNGTVYEIYDATAARATDVTNLQTQITANAEAIELLTNGANAEEIDSVNDLIRYVNEHGAEVTGMKNDIKANADAIDALADIASTGNVNDLVQTSGDVIVLDCGTSTINV